MSEMRLIDANVLKVRMFRSKEFNYETGSFDLPVVPWHDIEDADTIDAVPVVRCRECVHNEDEDVCPFVRVNRGENWFEIIKPHPDGFCHMGAKMDGGV